MKLIKTFIHHGRTVAVVEALADAGFRNLTFQDVKGMLKPITKNERDYSGEASGLVISEVRLSLVVDDAEVAPVASIIRTVARVGTHKDVCGYVYVRCVEQAHSIGGPQ